ncbi:hypothetical protein JG687_00011503 [Phytophthora cactorum]|uniref:Uncharacterized protein n=1 Tax=Phytophthora cactorum TaxID=29920 RepID=A0A8T1U4F2_9STRA|nr:hypothetical protein JG687_00011503 [Phytophthora cactorum]
MCLRYRSAGTGTLPNTDLTNDRCPRRKDGAPTVGARTDDAWLSKRSFESAW